MTATQAGSMASRMLAHLACHPEGLSARQLADGTGATLINARIFLRRGMRDGLVVMLPPRPPLYICAGHEVSPDR